MAMLTHSIVCMKGAMVVTQDRITWAVWKLVVFIEDG